MKIKKNNCVIIATTAMIMSGCAAHDVLNATGEAVPLSQMINSLKCGFGSIELDRTDRAELRGVTAAIALTSSFQRIDTVSGNINAADLAVASDLALDLGHGFSRSGTKTTTSTVEFGIEITEGDTGCGRTANVDVTAFTIWLQDTLDEIELAEPGFPLAEIGKLTYETSFKLIRVENQSAKFKFVPVSVGAGGSQSRTDTHTMKAVIVPTSRQFVIVGTDE